MAVVQSRKERHFTETSQNSSNKEKKPLCCLQAGYLRNECIIKMISGFISPQFSVLGDKRKKRVAKLYPDVKDIVQV